MADQEQVLNRVQNLLTEVYEVKHLILSLFFSNGFLRGSMDAVALDPEARKELAGLQNTYLFETKTVTLICRT